MSLDCHFQHATRTYLPFSIFSHLISYSSIFLGTYLQCLDVMEHSVNYSNIRLNCLNFLGHAGRIWRKKSSLIHRFMVISENWAVDFKVGAWSGCPPAGLLLCLSPNTIMCIQIQIPQLTLLQVFVFQIYVRDICTNTQPVCCSTTPGWPKNVSDWVPDLFWFSFLTRMGFS